MEHSPDTVVTSTAAQKRVTAFVCTNCVRAIPERGPWSRHSSAGLFPQACAVQEITIPCTGRLQPEHLLRAIEEGADLVCIVGCAEDNCHFLEGSRRAGRRGEYVKQMLAEIGVGGERILMVHLPGSARQDLAAGEGAAEAESGEDEFSRQAAAVTAEVAARLGSCPANPLGRPPAPEEEVMVTENGEENED